MQKENLSDYTEAEFLQLLQDIYEVNVETEEEHLELVDHFRKLSEHPDGADLFYYPGEGSGSPEEVLQQVKKWRAENGLGSFKRPWSARYLALIDDRCRTESKDRF